VTVTKTFTSLTSTFSVVPALSLLFELSVEAGFAEPVALEAQGGLGTWACATATATVSRTTRSRTRSLKLFLAEDSPSQISRMDSSRKKDFDRKV
jgi:hypothetical protein